MGLSPRVRGSLTLPQNILSHNRSIPACAGQPNANIGMSIPHWVYPRVCGAATSSSRLPERTCGLSPRVRGSPPFSSGLKTNVRSIPACAGQPTPHADKGGSAGVYPRVCGAATSTLWTMRALLGLSPRVRGSLRRCDRHRDRGRSIPACAGQPPCKLPLVWREQVYPRVCGAALVVPSDVNCTLGLSPRVRGSRYRSIPLQRRHGSIPACAGQPSLCSFASAMP